MRCSATAAASDPPGRDDTSRRRVFHSRDFDATA